MQNPTNNSDIQYLVQMFEQQLDLLRDYSSHSNLDPVSKSYIQSFTHHVQHNKNTENTQITDFIDYGTKLMAYLSKNGVKDVDISNKGLNQIFNSMINPELLRQPLLQSINYKIKMNGKKQDIDKLKQALSQLEKKPINYEKFKQKLSQVTQL